MRTADSPSEAASRSTWLDRELDHLRREPLAVLLTGVSLLLWISCYSGTLGSLIERWNTDPNYSHGYFVPLISLYIFQQSIERRPLTQFLQGGAWIGGAILLAAILLLWTTTVLPSLVLESASMILGLAGIVCFAFGRQVGARALAPILFLIFMVPWPSKLYSQVAFPLQLAISQVASVLVSLLGIPVLCDGSLLHLPGQTMHVAEACSGMRQLTAFLAMAAAMALILDRPTWFRITLLAGAVPVALLVNIVRVTLMALMHYAGLGEWTTGTLHTLEGMIMVMAGLGVMLLLVRLLDWICVPAPVATSNLKEAIA